MNHSDFKSYSSELLVIAGGRESSIAMIAAKRHAMLDDLLAIIFRDGGQYVVKHGYSKSIKDAIKLCAEMNK